MWAFGKIEFLIKAALFAVLSAALAMAAAALGGERLTELFKAAAAALISSAAVAAVVLTLGFFARKKAKRQAEEEMLSDGEYRIAKCAAAAYMPIAAAAAIDFSVAFFMLCFYFKRPDVFADITRGETGRVMLPVIILFNIAALAFTVSGCGHAVLYSQTGFTVLCRLERKRYLWSDCEKMVYCHSSENRNKSRFVITAGGSRLVLRGDRLYDGWEALIAFSRQEAKARGICFDIYTV